MPVVTQLLDALNFTIGMGEFKKTFNSEYVA